MINFLSSSFNTLNCLFRLTDYHFKNLFLHLTFHLLIFEQLGQL